MIIIIIGELIGVGFHVQFRHRPNYSPKYNSTILGVDDIEILEIWWLLLFFSNKYFFSLY